MNLIKQIFEEFNKNKINYSIIRNYEFLVQNKEYYDGKDIDILVKKSDYKKLENLILKNNFFKIDLNYGTNHKAFVNTKNKQIISLHIHLGGISGTSTIYLNEKILINKKLKNSFYTLDEKDQFIALILHIILDGKEWRETYKTQAIELIEKSNKLYTYFSKNIANEIIEKIKNKEFDNFNVKKYKLNYKLNNPSFTFSKISYMIKSFIWVLKRIFKGGNLIAVVGLDGTGKTTLTDNVNNYYKKSLK